MKDKFNLGIEISSEVANTAVPQKIKRYDNVVLKHIKLKTKEKTKVYRYRPGVNCFMTGDLDV